MNHFLQTFLIFLVGLVGGLCGYALMSSPPAALDVASSPAPAVSPDSALEQQIKGLQVALDSLSRQVELQSSTFLSLQDRVSGVIAMDRSLRQGRLPGGAERPLALGDMPTGPGFDAAVDAVIQQREEKNAAERSDRREQRRQEQLEQHVTDLAQQLGLNEAQTEIFSQALDASSVARNEFFTDMRENGFSNREAIGEKMTAIREKELEQLGGVLSPEQLGQYQELSAFRGFGGGGFGGGNGGNRNGGAGGPGSNGGRNGNRGGGF